MIRTAFDGRIYAFEPPRRPDPSGLVWREVTGWACDCTGPGAGHPAVDCPGRYRVTVRVPTYPEHDRERAARDRRHARQDASGEPQSRVITPAREWSEPDDLLPSGARRLGVLTSEIGRKVRITYAEGWGRRRTGIGKGAFEPWPVATVAVRISGIGWACWERFAQHGGREPTAWRAAGAMALWQGRWYRVTHAQLGKLVKEIGRG